MPDTTQEPGARRWGPDPRLRELRRAWAARGEQRTMGEAAYLAYVVILMTALVAVPALAVVLDALRSPAVIGVIGAPEAGVLAVVAVTLGWAAALGLGAALGPVTMSPALVPLRAGTDLPRHWGLAGVFAARAVALCGVWVLLGGLLAAALFAEQLITPRELAVALAVSASAGIVAAVAWLAGQVFARRGPWLATGIAAVAVAFARMVPDGATISGSTATALIAALALGTCAAVALTPRLLDLLRGPSILAGSFRWQSATSSARYGDITGALASLQALPRRGRSWRAVVEGPTVVRFAVADLVGATRTTGRLLAGAVGLVTASLALAATHHRVATALAAVLAFVALGSVTDGLRRSAALAVGPPVLGLGTATLFALHAVAPLAFLTVTGATGWALAATLVPGVEAPSSALVLVLVLPLVALVRAWHAAKGPLPVVFLTPAPSPMGDLSGVSVALWLSDAVIIAAIIGAGAGALLGDGRVADAVVGAVIAAAFLTVTLRRRLARL